MRLLSKLVFALAAVAALTIAAPAAAQTKLKWAHVYETSEPYHKWSVWAADEIKKRTNGRYEIQVFPASSLGKESDINQGLTLGTVDIILTGASLRGAHAIRRSAIALLPVHLPRRRSPAQVRARATSFKRARRRATGKKTGNQITAITYYGARQTTSNKPFTDCAGHEGPEDPRARRAGLPGASRRRCGANPTPIAFAEVYLALQNGTVDAQENPLPTIEAKKFYEVQKNISLTGHIVDSLLTRSLRHVWSKLSDADKKIFTDVMQEAAEKRDREITQARSASWSTSSRRRASTSSRSTRTRSARRC